MNRVEPYDPIAELYDEEFREFDEDIRVYREWMTLKRPRDVLELGCGTCRVALRLALLGYFVVGIDRSIEMLKVALRRIKSLRAEGAVKLVCADMARFELKRRFNNVIIPLSSFAFLDGDGRRSCLERVRRHLRPGGRLIIDLFSPNIESLASRPRSLRETEFANRSRGTIVKKVVREEFDPKSRRLTADISYVELEYGSGRVMGEHRTRLSLSVISREEMEALFEEAGFAVLECLGDYRGNRFGPHSPRMIFIASPL